MLRADSRIVELGAGTGLVSLVLSEPYPRISGVSASVIATDYHPTVLGNLETNITAHVGGPAATAPIQASISTGPLLA